MRALRLGAAIAGVTAGLCAGTARADAPPPSSYPAGYTPVYAPTVTYDWTGIYAGGNAGGAVARTEWTYDGFLDPFFGTPESVEHSRTGFVGGGFAGLQKQWSWIVVGAEAGYLWMDLTKTSVSANAPGNSLTSNVSNLMLVTGKFGWAYENMLASFKGGWAMADVDFRTNTTSTGALLTSSSGRQHGWTVGASLEYAVWDHVILGVEYDYVQLNAGRTQLPVVPGPATHVDSGIDIQSLTARLSFKFGGGWRP
jgi:outer membrane immunogenic protein